MKLVEDFLCCGQPEGNSDLIGAGGHSQKRFQRMSKTPPINVELRVMRHALDRFDLLFALGQAGEKIDHVGIARDAVGRYENLYRRAATGMLK